MRFDFSGKVLLLTGASGGIGEAIAQVFYEAGARILLADLRDAEKLAGSLDASGKRVAATPMDAARPEDADAVVKFCLSQFGRLDFLVPAAAIYKEQSFLTMTDEQWRNTLSINLDGVFYICRRAVPVMQDGGSIVTISSEAAHTGSSIGHVHYGASKGGILTFTRSLARELAPRIRVNTVSPGTIDTAMVKGFLNRQGPDFVETLPMKRLGRPQEVAFTVAFLCSDAANYITGQAIHPNGGSYMGG